MNTHARAVLIGGVAVVLAACSREQAITSPMGPAPDLSVSATGKPAAASSTTTMSVGGNGCDITVTYTWNGFKGRDLIASFGMYERLGSLDGSFNLVNIEGQRGASGTLTHVFHLTPGGNAGRYILARGALYNSRTFQQIAGTTSGTASTWSTCGDT